jgi:hypothetical protein
MWGRHLVADASGSGASDGCVSFARCAQCNGLLASYRSGVRRSRLIGPVTGAAVGARYSCP